MKKAVFCRYHDDGVDDEVYCGMVDSANTAKQVAVDHLDVCPEGIMDHVAETDEAFYVVVDS